MVRLLRSDHILLLRRVLASGAMLLFLPACFNADIVWESMGVTISSPSTRITVGQSMTLQTIGGAAPFKYSKISGLGEVTEDGIFTAPTSSLGTATIRVTDAAGSISETVITVVDRPPEFTFPSTIVLNREVAMTAVGPTAPSGGAVITYLISPAPPAGIVFDASTGVLSGKPTVALKEQVFTVTAVNSGGSFQKSLSLLVKEIPPSALSYEYSWAVYLKGATFPANHPTATAPVYSIGIDSYSVAPPLPPGITLDSTTGVISGTPSGPVDQAVYTVTATNSGGSISTPLRIKVGDTEVTCLKHEGSCLALTGQFEGATEAPWKDRFFFGAPGTANAGGGLFVNELEKLYVTDWNRHWMLRYDMTKLHPEWPDTTFFGFNTVWNNFERPSQPGSLPTTFGSKIFGSDADGLNGPRVFEMSDEILNRATLGSDLLTLESNAFNLPYFAMNIVNGTIFNGSVHASAKSVIGAAFSNVSDTAIDTFSKIYVLGTVGSDTKQLKAFAFDNITTGTITTDPSEWTVDSSSTNLFVDDEDRVYLFQGSGSNRAELVRLNSANGTVERFLLPNPLESGSHVFIRNDKLYISFSNEASDSALKNTVRVYRIPPPIEAPESEATSNVTATRDDNTVHLQWPYIANAETIRVYRQKVTNDEISVTLNATRTGTRDVLTENGIYDYSVKFSNSKGEFVTEQVRVEYPAPI
ncbi:MAG: hypothetical protein A2603_00995 [Bdellovibrionales bacterium RIFOXYD1_FULL_55_31]|nr:MAG: hypothetical protein A2603_00995 [Bdellovibrionales bacterium RIFOXYD1_FULL_55_31]